MCDGAIVLPEVSRATRRRRFPAVASPAAYFRTRWVRWGGMIRDERDRQAIEFAYSRPRSLTPRIVGVNEAAVSLPGYELVSAGLADLAGGRETEASLVVAMAARRLRAVGVEVPEVDGGLASHRLYALLCERDFGGAHSSYNALVGRVVSFARAAEHASAG